MAETNHTAIPQNLPTLIPIHEDALPRIVAIKRKLYRGRLHRYVVCEFVGGLQQDTLVNREQEKTLIAELNANGYVLMHSMDGRNNDTKIWERELNDSI